MGRLSRLAVLLALALGADAARQPTSRPALAGREPARAPLRLRGGAAPPAATGAVQAQHPQPELHAAAAGAVEQWWAENKKLLLAIGGALALLAPALRSLPRQAAFTAAVLVVALVQMAFDAKPEQVLLEATVALVGAGTITMKDALAGFSSEGVVAVAVMCAVAKGLQTTGGLELIAKFLLGTPGSYTVAQLRMVLSTLAISAFMNNTPVCAMLMPILSQWAKGLGLDDRGLLMPLSFATMLGGTITLIGSSTNLVARTAAMKQDPSFNMGVFDITAVGLINAAAGTAYMALAAPRLLPGASGRAAAPPAAAKAESAVKAPRGEARLWLALGLLATTMTIAAQSPKMLLLLALGCLCLLLRTGCMGLKDAWAAVNGPVLLSIALSFALGTAIDKSELASIVAAKIVALVAPYGQLALLFAVYFVAICIGAVISNNAVVVLMFPILVKVCEGAGISWKPSLYALTMAASASFSTPVSYQTNLMVANEAGYSFTDFIKFGLPLQLVCMLATVPACHVLFK